MSILPVIGGAAANPPPPNPYTYGDEYIWKTLLQFYMTTDSNKTGAGNYIGTPRELIYNYIGTNRELYREL